MLIIVLSLNWFLNKFPIPSSAEVVNAAKHFATKILSLNFFVFVW